MHFLKLCVDCMWKYCVAMKIGPSENRILTVTFPKISLTPIFNRELWAIARRVDQALLQDLFAKTKVFYQVLRPCVGFYKLCE